MVVLARRFACVGFAFGGVVLARCFASVGCSGTSVSLEYAGRDRAVLRYDPADLGRLYLWQDGRVVTVARPVALLHRVSRRKPTRGEHPSQAARNYLNRLERAHVERLGRELNLTR